MDRYQNSLGIVIKSHRWQDSDLIINLLTPSLGKISVIAKGAQNIKSRRLGSLQLGNIIKVHLYQRGDYLWLSEVTTISQFLQEKKHLTQINLLFYFLELLNKLIADNQHIPGVYQISTQVITAINANQLAQFIHYEIEFINTLGFGLPQNILDTYADKDYVLCQKLIRHHLESILDHPLQSSKLFS